MKALYWFVVIALSLVLIVSVVVILHYYNRINNVYDDETVHIFDDEPNYHFSLILNSKDDVYWQEFKEGVFEAANVYNIAIELNPVTGPSHSSQMMEYIKIAAKSKIDGIIVNGDNTIEFNDIINETANDNINIVLAGEEAGESKLISYVGTNHYEYGIQAAKLIAQAKDEVNSQVNLAVIHSSQNNEDERIGALHSDTMMKGLRSYVDEDPQIELISTLYRNSDLLGAEDLTRDILTQNRDVNVIFCTNAKDSVAAARVIVERNLVGQVVVVGTDVTQEVIYYIEKGVISGVVDRNGYKAGYKSVEILRNSIGETFQSNYVVIDIDIYNKANITTYK